MPDHFLIDDNMIIRPQETDDPAAIVIQRGPNIGGPPTSLPLPEDLDGVVTIKVGDKITTDHIIPAGARMKYRSNIRTYSDFVFENLDPEFARRATTYRDAGKHNLIVAGVSYGQGSSREHASICPSFLGVKAVLAKSFERIHAANLINFGIIPLTFADPADYDRLAQGDAVIIPNIRNQIQSGGVLMLSNRTTGIQFEVKADLTERQRAIVVAGGALSIHQ